MTDYNHDIARLERATSLEEIQTIVRQYSAKAVGEGGVLYSGEVGEARASKIANESAARENIPIIDKTPRGQFLANEEVEGAIKESVQRIFEVQGQNKAIAIQSRDAFLYGDAKAPIHSPTSIHKCLWGEASREFAGSLRGDIQVVAVNAAPDRVFAQVEIPTALEVSKAHTLGGVSTDALRSVRAQGGDVLPLVQANYITEALREGRITSIPSGKSVVAEPPMAEPPPATKLSPTATPGAAEAAPEAILPKGLSPSGRLMLKGAGAAGIALMAYDFASTGHKVIELRSQGNDTGADSAWTHFAGRTGGGLAGSIAGGFVAGAGYGLVVGSESGPGALATGLIGGVIGGAYGAYRGEKWAEQRDNDKIFIQTDKNGNEWHRDPSDPKGAWTLSTDAQQPKAGAEGDTVYKDGRYQATGSLAQQLNYQSANVSYELGLANPAKPRNPYSIPSEQDQPGWVTGNWNRDAQTGTWSRLLVQPMSDSPLMETQQATPGQASALEKQSQIIVAENAANTPAAMAARYQIAYNHFGWERNGPVPDAVKNAAASVGTLRASDGNKYTQGANGEWINEGMLYNSKAEGNIRNELNAVSRSQQAGLADMAAIAQYAKEHPQLESPDQQPRNTNSPRQEPRTVQDSSNPQTDKPQRVGAEPANQSLGKSSAKEFSGVADTAASGAADNPFDAGRNQPMPPAQDMGKKRLLVMNGQRILQAEKGGVWTDQEVGKADGLKPNFYNLYLGQAADKKQTYTGVFVHADAEKVYQETGKNRFVVHARRDFDETPEIGSAKSISYDTQGKANVGAAEVVSLSRGRSR